MRPLRGLVADYLRVRRSLGYKLIEHERFLTQFLDYLEQTQATTITAENALTWAKLPANANPRWHGARLSALRGFAAWAQAFNPDIQVPPTGLLPMHTVRATPYLYSEDQIRALINAAASLTPQVRSATFRTWNQTISSSPHPRVDTSTRRTGAERSVGRSPPRDGGRTT